MNWRSKLAVFLAIVFLGFGSMVAASNKGKVTITSPTSKQVFTTNSVTVNWTMDPGKEGDHVHLYLDGKLLGPKYGSSFTLENLKPGKHNVELRLATKNHKELKPKAKVKFKVKG